MLEKAADHLEELRPFDLIYSKLNVDSGKISLRNRFYYWHSLSYGPPRFFILCARRVKLRRLQRNFFSLWWSFVKYPAYEACAKSQAPRIWGIQDVLKSRYNSHVTTYNQHKQGCGDKSNSGSISNERRKPTKSKIDLVNTGRVVAPKFSESLIMIDSALNPEDWSMHWAHRCSSQTNGLGAKVHKGLLLRACSARAKLRAALPSFSAPGNSTLILAPLLN